MLANRRRGTPPYRMHVDYRLELANESKLPFVSRLSGGADERSCEQGTTKVARKRRFGNRLLCGAPRGQLLNPSNKLPGLSTCAFPGRLASENAARRAAPKPIAKTPFSCHFGGILLDKRPAAHRMRDAMHRTRANLPLHSPKKQGSGRGIRSVLGVCVLPTPETLAA